MNIRLSSNINSHDCTTCANRQPWDQTIADIEHQLRSHGVTWPDFKVMHGRNLSCAAALGSSGQKNAGLYVVATDARGNEVRSANVFARKDPHYVGVRAILDGTAFGTASTDDEDPMEFQAPYAGTLIWSNGDRASVISALMDQDRLAFDAKSAGGAYTVVLHPHPNSDQWVGRWTSGGRSGVVNARLKRDGDDLEVTGRWLDGEDYGWELTLSMT